MLQQHFYNSPILRPTAVKYLMALWRGGRSYQCVPVQKSSYYKSQEQRVKHVVTAQELRNYFTPSLISSK